MSKIDLSWTVAEVLNLNPMTAKIFYQYGIRTLFDQTIANQTLKSLGQLQSIDLFSLVEDLNNLLMIGIGSF